MGEGGGRGRGGFLSLSVLERQEVTRAWDRV